MTNKFHRVTRFLSVALAGFALLAAGKVPQIPAPAVAVAATTDIDNAEAVAAAPTVRGDIAALESNDDTHAPAVTPDRPASLSKLVAQVADLPATPLNADAKCLTTAVFFEARGEPLEGQLAVAQVILNRVASGRYAGSVCGVVNQPGQFTFAKRSVNTASSDWRTAQAIAIIAQAERWLQVAPRAMAFHAARVSPGWSMQRISRIGNHVFYR